MKRIIGVNSNCYHGYSIEEAVRGAAAAGFHYIELTATKGWTEHVFPDQSFHRLLEVKKLLKEYNMTPFAMSGHCNLMDRERMEDFIENIKLAAFLGCDYIVSSVGEAHLKDQAVASNETVAQHISDFIPYLEEFDMTLVLEVHGEHGNGNILKEIVNLVGNPRVKINYDTANAIFYGGVNVADDLRNCADQVAYMHLKDKVGQQKEWNFPALGDGEIDFSEIFEILKENENRCPFSIEIEFTEKGPGDLKEIDDAVKKSALYLQQAGFEL